MTSTLADLAGVPGLSRDGQPIYVERVRLTDNPDFARCDRCGYIMGEGKFSPMGRNVILHRVGNCRGTKISYWRYL